jgi:hypothetical protein
MLKFQKDVSTGTKVISHTIHCVNRLTVTRLINVLKYDHKMDDFISIVKFLKAVRIEFFLNIKVANNRCFILIVVQIFHNIIRK